MLRITLRPSDDMVVIQLEGCLAGAWVAELENCWHQALSASGGRVRVDLRSVCHVDDDGRTLMTEMHKAGAAFMASGCLMPEVVREVTQVNCGVDVRSGS
jgi:anti-anti-sigma regulatory factor